MTVHNLLMCSAITLVESSVIALAGGGCKVLGITNTTAATTSADYGKFEYHSRPQFDLTDGVRTSHMV